MRVRVRKRQRRSTEKASHLHTVVIDGSEYITTSSDGSPHTHTITLANGEKATSTQSKGGEGHSHKFTIAGSKHETSEPKSETEKMTFPYELTFECVRRGDVPVDKSGLPESLEADVPGQFRWWLVKDEAKARLVHRDLVESGVFTESTVRKVDGDLRLVHVETVEKVFLVKVEDGEPVVPPKVRDIEKVASALNISDAVLFDLDTATTFGTAEMVEKVAALDKSWVCEVPDTPQNRQLFDGVTKVFHKSVSGRFYATSSEDLSSELLVLIKDPTTLSKALDGERTMPILKSEEEERFIYGIVLEPDGVDAHGDTIDAPTIRKAAHEFMEHHRTLGLQHQEVINGDVVILESFIAPSDFEISGQTVKKGAWVMAERVVSDKLWKAINAGEITGFSIGGVAHRVPV